MTSKLVRVEAPIKGVFGDQVNVGDRVAIMTTGFSSACLRKGKYLGYIKCKGYYSQRAQVEIETDVIVHVKPDGTDFNWKTDYSSSTWNQVFPTLTTKKVKRTYVSTLKLNRIATLKD